MTCGGLLSAWLCSLVFIPCCVMTVYCLRGCVYPMLCQCAAMSVYCCGRPLAMWTVVQHGLESLLLQWERNL